MPVETEVQETTPEHKEKMDLMSDAATEDAAVPSKPTDTEFQKETQPQQETQTSPAKPAEPAPTYSGNEDQLPMA